ncbi:MAG: hypothetical protein JWQ60_5397 [Pseudonocardia sp.]|jgi:hypothetical protein|nr:hypothetical protein [Pseudonocardia sp.]
METSPDMTMTVLTLRQGSPILGRWMTRYDSDSEVPERAA